MPLHKVCPVCKSINDLTANICERCNIDIAGISPIDTDNDKEEVADSQFKICGNCGTKNNQDEIVCKNCLEVILEKPKRELKEKENDEKDISAPERMIKNKGTKDKRDEKSHIIVQCTKGGEKIVISNGDILGRHCKGKEILLNYKTISRKHVMFIHQNGKWYIRDLETPNYTYVNGKKIAPYEDYQLNDGDRINLAEEIEFIIKFD